MKNLNLIPPAYKDRLRLQRIYSLVRMLLIIIILYIISLGIILLVARFILVNNFTRIVGETTLVTRVNRDIENDIRNMNNEISAAKTIQTKAIPWSEFLVSFGQIVPDGIVLNSIDFKADAANRATITGTASTRESLLLFEDHLTNALFVSDVDLPFKYKQDKVDILFSLSITVKFDKIPLL